MHYLDYNEQIQHRTGDFPLAFYPVDQRHPRYRMPMHWHREAELIRVQQGRLKLYIDEREILAEAGDLLLIGTGVLHGGEPEDCVYECIVFDPDLLLAVAACKRRLSPLFSHSLFLKGTLLNGDAALRGAVARLYERCAGGIVGEELKVMTALYDTFGVMIDRRYDAGIDAVSNRFGQKAEQLKPALEYIETHYGQSITLETLARLTGMSPKYFCRFFKALVHRSPIDYVNYYRIECASHFLSTTDMTVAEIAQHCGYNDSSFFIKQFRKYKNTTPRQYRQGSAAPLRLSAAE